MQRTVDTADTPKTLTVFINLLKPTQGLNEPIPTAQGARKAR